MRWEQKVQYATLSDIGLRRRNNQDSFCVQLCSDKDNWTQRGHIFIVADGMGGHAVGELASKMAVDAIPLTYFKSRAPSVSQALTEAIEHANKVIYERGSQNRDFNRMGTTCVALVLSPHGATLGHIGDSRAYRIRGDRIEQLTFDHSLQWELERQGRLKKNDVFLPEVRHVITRSLGPEETVEVEIDGPMAVFPNDKFLLCSDGLTGHVSDAEIGMIVRELPPAEAVRLLVNMANMRGGSDNSTVIIVHCGDIPAGAQAAAADPGLEDAAPSGWQSLVFLLATAITSVGAAFLAARRWAIGSVITVLGLAAMAFVIWRWVQHKRRADSGDGEKTVVHRAYRVASARPSKEFIARLAHLETELRKMASEEAWPIDWDQHDRTIASARLALDRRLASQAMSELGKAIDLLMSGLHLHRKRLKQQSASDAETPDV